MSSNLDSARRRPHVGRLKRLALSAVAVTVGAIVLSGCVAIQSESATQANLIGNSVTVSTVICASQAAAAAPCNSAGNSGQYAPTAPNASQGGQLLVGYRIPAGVTAPATITTTVPSTASDGSATTTTLTLTQNASYTAGLTALLPPGGAVWVGYASDVRNYTSGGPQAVTIAPTFGLPAGFVGPFAWRTVVGYRSALITGDVQCPPPFPGTVASPIPGQQGSVCVDNPDLATINGAPSQMQLGDLSIVAPATPTISAGSSATLGFTGLFSGGNPSGSGFTVAASTTLPGVTPSVAASFVPANNSSNALPVSFAIPASTPVGTYDVTVSATIAGITRSGTGHITVKAPAKATITATTSSAKLSASVKKTTLKVARKTGIPVTFTLSRASAISVVALQAKPKVSVTVKKTLKAGKKTVVLVKSARLHKGKVTITFKGGGLTRVVTTTLS